MARLPSGRFLVQQLGEDVWCFEDHTERTIARFNLQRLHTELDPAKEAIANSDMPDEDKELALFWFGYFWGVFSRENNPPVTYELPIFRREPGISAEELIDHIEALSETRYEYQSSMEGAQDPTTDLL